MKIFRLEYPDCGSGPYWNRYTHGLYKCLESHMYSSSHPGLIDEKLENPDAEDWFYIETKCKAKFAFESYASMRKWFNKYQWKKINAAGYVLAVYEVQEKNIRRGTKQVMFTGGRKTLYPMNGYNPESSRNFPFVRS